MCVFGIAEEHMSIHLELCSESRESSSVMGSMDFSAVWAYGPGFSK